MAEFLGQYMDMCTGRFEKIRGIAWLDNVYIGSYSVSSPREYHNCSLGTYYSLADGVTFFSSNRSERLSNGLSVFGELSVCIWSQFV